MDLSSWKGVARPGRVTLEGCYARLEPLDLERHRATLYESAQAPGAANRFRYLSNQAPDDLGEFNAWLETAVAGTDPLFFAVIDKATGRAEGRQSFLRIDPANGVIEIGHILWGPAIARSRVATEALFLIADYAFSLGYRRFEWKCDSRNDPSRRAAERFGFCFEGIFRQHMIIKGQNRDTAWFAMTDGDWARLKPGYERWLGPENFDEAEHQRSKLTF